MPDTSFLLKDQDPTVKPGDDFYQFAVGNWLKNNPIPETHGRWGSFEILVEENYEKLRTLLESLGSTDSLAAKLREFYNSGMDESAVEKGLEAIKETERQIRKLSSASELPKLLATLHRKGAGVFFAFLPEPDAKQSSMVIATLWQRGLGLMERNYYLADDEATKVIREKYVKHIERMFELFGEQDPAGAAGKVFAVELEIAKASRAKEALRDPNANYNDLSPEALQKISSDFAWSKYFVEAGVSVSKLNVSQPDFIESVLKLLNSLPLEDIKTYLLWHLYLASADALPERFVEEKFEFYGKVLRGQKKIKERFKRVIDEMDETVGEAVGRFYVERYFPPTAKERAEAMVGNIISTMGERIGSLSWMGSETKAKALKKLRSIRVKIGYPSKWIDYGSWLIGSSFYENITLGREFEWARQMNKIGKPVDPTDWLMSPQTVNAYYEPVKNEIVFPAAILQPPFFFADADDAMNYGGIGVVIGHEITHGFDDSGRHFDEKGELTDWWTKEDEAKFKTLAENLVKQYDAFDPQNGMRVNGTFTQGENIADLGGVCVCLSALKKLNDSKVIDGLTQVQRFFLAYAHVWKNNIREEMLRTAIMVDPHSPGKYRVLGPLQNVEEFFKAFEVKPTEAMYRKGGERVVIW